MNTEYQCNRCKHIFILKTSNILRTVITPCPNCGSKDLIYKAINVKDKSSLDK